MNVLFFLKPKATVAYVFHDNTLRQALEKMRFYGYQAIPVIDREGKYMGTVTEGDFLWKLADSSSWENRAQERLYVRDIMRAGHNPSVNINASIEDLLLMAMNQNFVPVVDDLGSFIGIVTRRDIMQYYYKATHGERPETPLKLVDQSLVRQQ
ncbi:MAG TPA: CBS domain-containing protein [Clostridia bacterium]|nr:MAG: CBS domain protein [Firmicutes bacterium ADurb.Bin248]HOG00436.1 CBS domain-containing protein [Clostridia bacterium]HOS18985.1 CBS domain-containing protein [Clostridia bacterium]HPK16164.1 CBS domain-containing protein [Clostridia bacterium]